MVSLSFQSDKQPPRPTGQRLLHHKWTHQHKAPSELRASRMQSFHMVSVIAPPANSSALIDPVPLQAVCPFLYQMIGVAPRPRADKACLNHGHFPIGYTEFPALGPSLNSSLVPVLYQLSKGHTCSRSMADFQTPRCYRLPQIGAPPTTKISFTT